MRIASWNDDQPTTIRQGGLHGHRPVAAHGKGALRPGGPAAARRDAGIVDIAAARPPPPLSAKNRPRQLGPYLIYERIARGSLSWVHLGCGSPTGDRKLVAVKLLDPQAASDPAVLAMLLHEARLGSQIRHPNVVRTLDLIVNPEQGRLGLVTEYIQGESLSRLVRRSVRLRTPVPIEHAAGIVVAVLRGLQAVHEATGPEGAPLGIVHRDISPQNIVVGIDGGVRRSTSASRPLWDRGSARTIAACAASRDTWLQSRFAAIRRTGGSTSSRRAWFCGSSSPGVVFSTDKTRTWSGPESCTGTRRPRAASIRPCRRPSTPSSSTHWRGIANIDLRPRRILPTPSCRRRPSRVRTASPAGCERLPLIWSPSSSSERRDPRRGATSTPPRQRYPAVAQDGTTGGSGARGRGALQCRCP